MASTPDTPTADPAAAIKPGETSETTVLPGTFPESPTNDMDKPFSINPVILAPGEPIPPEYKAGDATTNNLNKQATLDKEFNENAEQDDLARFDLPPATKKMIPESSLPLPDVAKGNALINTVGPTTIALADKVPLMSKTSQPDTGDKPAAETKGQDDSQEEKEFKSLTSTTTAATVAPKDAVVEKATDTSSATHDKSDAPAKEGAAQEAAGEEVKQEADAPTPNLGDAIASTEAQVDKAPPDADTPGIKKDEAVAEPAAVIAASAPTVEAQEISPEVAPKTQPAGGNAAPVTKDDTVAGTKEPEPEPTAPKAEPSSKAAPKTEDKLPAVDSILATADPAPAASTEADKPTDKPADNLPTTTTTTAPNSSPPSTPQPASTQAISSKTDTPSSSAATGTKGESTAGSMNGATAEQRKKNRLSVLFGRIKNKITHK